MCFYIYFDHYNNLLNNLPVYFRNIRYIQTEAYGYINSETFHVLFIKYGYNISNTLFSQQSLIQIFSNYSVILIYREVLS